MTAKNEEVKIEKLQKLDQETLERLIEIYMSAYEGMREYGGEGRATRSATSAGAGARPRTAFSSPRLEIG